MSFFGKPPARQPNRAFDLAQQNGEQVDAVRSKIASLLDGATEKRGTKPTDPATEPNEPLVSPAPTSTPQDESAATETQYDQTIDRSSFEQNDWPADREWPRRQNRLSEGEGQIGQSTEAAANEQSRPSHWERPFGNDLPTTASMGRDDNIADSDFHEAKTNLPIVTQGVEERDRDATPASMAWDAIEQNNNDPAADAINIKGRAGGILIELGHGNWPVLVRALTSRLADAGNFFRNGAVTLDLAARSLTESELHELHKLLTAQELRLALIRTGSQETFQAALDLGFAAQLETPDGETAASAQPAQSNLSNEPHFVYAGHLRAGQVLQRREHIVVIGDVNPGATVISNGDILVWGHLRGMAHAGAGGDTRALIAALNLAAVQLRISDYVAIAPEPTPKRRWGRQQVPVHQAEVAYIGSDRIVVEPWDATKFGGIATLRQ